MGATMTGDENALQQVYLNLALNAFRHTPAGGSLRISAQLTWSGAERKLRLEFVDNGSGVPEATQPHIFEAGFSGSGETPGLGLAVCRRIVEQHCGVIGLKYTAGSGATFFLEFPCEP